MTDHLCGTGRQLDLRSGDLQATVTQVGAAVRVLRHRGHDLLDGQDADEPARFAQGQTLVPWPNRLAGGRYRLEGDEQQLALTEPEKGNAIHGLARWLAWEVVEREPARAVLRVLVAAQAGYPRTVAVQATFTLGESGLEVTTEATNVGSAPAPWGSGAHPYVRAGGGSVDSARLRVPAETRLATDDRGIPTGERIAVAGSPYDFRAPRAIGDTQLDTAFGDLQRDADGRARIRLEDERAVTVWLDEAHEYVMAFTGDSLPEPARRRRALGVEPMTCAPDAFNNQAGLRVLAPGESATSTWGIEVEA